MQEKHFGLIGYPLNNSFSLDYFSGKFIRRNLPYQYFNFPIEEVSAFKNILNNDPLLAGLNVTKPHKQSIIPFLDHLAPDAEICGAVNCIKVGRDGTLTGYNTDLFGFKYSLEGFIGSNRNLKALVFGNGGAAKAVRRALEELHIPYQVVVRNQLLTSPALLYKEVSEEMMVEHKLLINTTPVGMFPETNEKLPLPYAAIGSDHFCYDLIYLPEKTAFLLDAERRGAQIKNGLEMLHQQANEAFRIWMKQDS